MIIAYSGVGGSGKSTHIKLIKKHFEEDGYFVSVYPLRDYFLWPKIIALFKKNKNETINPETVPPHTDSIFRIIYFWIRNTFYVLDMWRIYFYVLLPSEGKGIVICDRYFTDFIIELFDGDPRQIENMRRFRSLLPKPTFQVFFSIDPALALKRKLEHPLAYVENQQSIYTVLLTDEYSLIINASAEIEPITNELWRVFSLAYDTRNQFSFIGWLAYTLVVSGNTQVIQENIFIVNYDLLLQYVKQNRCVWSMLNLLSVSGKLQPEYQSLLTSGNRIKEEYGKTLEKVQTALSGLSYSLAKNDYQIELGSDLDIIFFSPNDYREALKRLGGLGTIKPINESKADISIEGYLPIDMHHGVTFGYYKYINIDSSTELDQGALFLALVIGHATSELIIVTLGDIAKVNRFLNDKNVVLTAQTIAEERGWGIGFKEWIRIAEKLSQNGYVLPQPMGLTKLFISRMGLAIKDPNIISFFSDLFILLRAWYARRQGIIPFHNSWTDSI